MSLPQRCLPHCICESMRVRVCVFTATHLYGNTYVLCVQFSVCAWAYCWTVKGTGLFIGLFERNSTASVPRKILSHLETNAFFLCGGCLTLGVSAAALVTRKQCHTS